VKYIAMRIGGTGIIEMHCISHNSFCEYWNGRPTQRWSRQRKSRHCVLQRSLRTQKNTCSGGC
jgi:hypothetical protein